MLGRELGGAPDQILKMGDVERRGSGAVVCNLEGRRSGTARSIMKINGGHRYGAFILGHSMATGYPTTSGLCIWMFVSCVGALLIALHSRVPLGPVLLWRPRQLQQHG